MTFLNNLYMQYKNGPKIVRCRTFAIICGAFANISYFFLNTSYSINKLVRKAKKMKMLLHFC